MNYSISIRLDPMLRRELERFCRSQRRPASGVIREALRRYLAVEQFRTLRRRALPRAQTQGLLAGEDAFRATLARAGRGQ